VSLTGCHWRGCWLEYLNTVSLPAILARSSAAVVSPQRQYLVAWHCLASACAAAISAWGQAPRYPVPRRIRRFMPVRRRQQIPHIGKQIALPYPFAGLVIFTKHDQRFDK
jgi:hypothetical protein